jgi:hypothetical protein
VSRDPIDLLVIGAGPARLTLALQAHIYGTQVRATRPAIGDDMAAPLVPLMLRSPGILSAALWLLGEFWVDYWHSPLSTDLAPKVCIGPRPGDRVADREVTCEGQQIRLHDLIVEPGIHVLLDRDAAPLEEAALAPCVRVHRLSSRPGKGVLIIRPDGYVGFRAASLDVEQVTGWLALAMGQRG